MSEKTKRKGTPIHPYVRLFAAFLPCIGVGILELVFFMSTGYICAAFPLSIVALVIVGNLVWTEEHTSEDEKPKRDEASLETHRLEINDSLLDEEITVLHEDTQPRARHAKL